MDVRGDCEAMSVRGVGWVRMSPIRYELGHEFLWPVMLQVVGVGE